MAITTLAQILDRLDEILNANVPSGTEVYRDRVDPESRDETPNVNVVARDDNSQPFAGEMDRHEVMVDVKFSVRDAVPTPVAEALHLAVHKPIVRDASLLALCDSVRQLGATFEPAEADATLLVKTVKYRFIYLIPQDTL